MFEIQNSMKCRAKVSILWNQCVWKSFDLENFVFESKFCVAMKQIIEENIEIANKMDTNSWIAKNTFHLV